MRTCFVIMPFEDKLDTYYSKLIKPTIEELKYTVIRSDEIYGIRPIIDDITNEIEKADILIADVTGKNPNVNYELGYAHAMKKSVIIISQTLDDIPFDYRHKRAIIYDITDVDWQDKLKDTIKETIKVSEKSDIIFEKIKNSSASELRSFLLKLTTIQIYNSMKSIVTPELYMTYPDAVECCINVLSEKNSTYVKKYLLFLISEGLSHEKFFEAGMKTYKNKNQTPLEGVLNELFIVDRPLFNHYFFDTDILSNKNIRNRFNLMIEASNIE
ncbi:MAG: hypothetical protein GX424_04630 [Clostridiales bacterium]|nr:hypothetical protein [Clostridiales bacterium]